MKTRPTLNPLPLLLAGAALLITGCPEEGLLCADGLTACNNQSCEDLQNDPRHCGGCNVACGTGEVCSAGNCLCAPGAERCGEVCVVTDSDPRHCGTCGNACAGGEVCQAGTCQADCDSGYTQCGQSCVQLDRDVANCGGCGVACDQGQTCEEGVCRYDAVLACLTNGQVVGVNAETFVSGTRRPLGAGPQSLATYGPDVLLSVDGTSYEMYQARLSNLQQLEASNMLGDIPNHVLVSDGVVYVINSGSGTLAAFRPVSGGGGPVGDAGITFEAFDEVDFGENSFPQVVTRVGDTLYVTLYGGQTLATAGAGQKVAEVRILPGGELEPGPVHDLSALELETFVDGGTSLPRPQGITERNGVLYVALNHLDEFYGIAGPAYLATLPLDGGTMGAVKLPEDACLNAGWVATAGENLLVSCAGQSDYSMFPIVTTTETGLVLVGPNDEILSAVELSCPADADGGCVSPSAGRFGVVGEHVLVGDQAAGRVFVIHNDGAQLTEVRTPATAAGSLNACPVGELGYSNVGDVLVVP